MMKVLGGANLSMPFTGGLETACAPQEEDIIAEVEKMMSRKGVGTAKCTE